MQKLKLYWRAARPFSFTVSIVPPILATAIAISENPYLEIKWFYLVLTILGCWLAHAGSNIFSDYFDFIKNVDRKDTLGGGRVLVEGLITPKDSLLLSLFCFTAASVIGAFFIAVLPRGITLIWLVAIGAFLGFFYTAKPFVIKYRALGDLAVFLAFGPAMCLGAFFVQANYYSWSPVFYAIPVALLVDAVLHSNNLRDIKSDKIADITTLPIMIGEENAKKMYYGLIIGAYIAILALIFFAHLTWTSLLTFVSLPLAIKSIKAVQNKQNTPPEEFATIDARTAQFHSAFSLLFIVSIIIGYFINR